MYRSAQSMFLLVGDSGGPPKNVPPLLLLVLYIYIYIYIFFFCVWPFFYVFIQKQLQWESRNGNSKQTKNVKQKEGEMFSDIINDNSDNRSGSFWGFLWCFNPLVAVEEGVGDALGWFWDALGLGEGGRWDGSGELLWIVINFIRGSLTVLWVSLELLGWNCRHSWRYSDAMGISFYFFYFLSFEDSSDSSVLGGFRVLSWSLLTFLRDFKPSESFKGLQNLQSF